MEMPPAAASRVRRPMYVLYCTIHTSSEGLDHDELGKLEVMEKAENVPCGSSVMEGKGSVGSGTVLVRTYSTHVVVKPLQNWSRRSFVECRLKRPQEWLPHNVISPNMSLYIYSDLTVDKTSLLRD